MLSAGNASLGKRKGQQSLVDILKRPFSRKSMTPPASPNSQLKQSKEDCLNFKVDEVVLQTEADSSEVEETSSGHPTVAENGPNSELFPLPLPPTPNLIRESVCKNLNMIFLILQSQVADCWKRHTQSCCKLDYCQSIYYACCMFNE